MVPRSTPKASVPLPNKRFFGRERNSREAATKKAPAPGWHSFRNFPAPSWKRKSYSFTAQSETL